MTNRELALLVASVLRTVAIVVAVMLCAYLLGQQRAFGSEPPPVRQPPAVKAAEPEKPKPKRVKLAGYWFDELPGGRYQWCEPCNGPYPAGGVPGLVVVEWPAAQAVAAPRPFPATTPATPARPVAGFSTSSTATTRTVRTATGVLTTGRYGPTGSGCVVGYG